MAFRYRPYWSKVFNVSNTFKALKRTYNTQSVRLRFAPSPTGYLHLGGLRTALYNYLYALSQNGIMILRIEDTDQTRKVEGATDALIENLEWSGIHCHEGPKQGGDFGPYIQSKRLHFYKSNVEKLLGNGSAYHCFCTPLRIDLQRREARKAGLVPKYDNRCRHLTREEIFAKLDKAMPYCIRFKLNSDCINFTDLIFGSITHDVALTEGDPVIMKSDGFPTYHFANVVDDHLMQVSHVLRGVEWQQSTTKHIQLYRAFGWEPPQYGHLPLIVNADGTKLSKRQDDIRVEDYRNKGIFPLALINYVTLAGGGFSHISGARLAVHSLHELASEFDIQKVNSHPSRLNPDLLEECNRLELVNKLNDEETCKEIVNKLENLVKKTFQNENLDLRKDHILNILLWATTRIQTWSDLVSEEFAFIWVLPPNQKKLEPAVRNNLLQLLVILESEQCIFEKSKINETLKGFAMENNIKFGHLMKQLRAVLSGLNQGPGVAEMMELLGKEVTVRRIQSALE